MALASSVLISFIAYSESGLSSLLSKSTVKVFNEQSLEKIRVNAANYSKDEHFSYHFRRKVNDIVFSVPYDILKNLFNSKEIKLFSEFDEKNEVANSTLGKIDSII